MENLTHSEAVLLEDHDGVVLSGGVTRDGDKFYVYILANKEGIQKLRHDAKAGHKPDFLSYGRIITYGPGELPPEEVQAEVRRKYGIKPRPAAW